LNVDKVFVAKQVATKLRATEAAVDAAMVEATELMADMIRGRVELKISAGATDPTMAKVAAAIAALAEARTAMENKVEDAPTQVTGLKEVA
jgi:hypothetical protein